MLQVLKVLENGEIMGVVEKVDGYTDYYTAEEYAQREEESRQVPALTAAQSRLARAELAAWRAAME